VPPEFNFLFLGLKEFVDPMFAGLGVLDLSAIPDPAG